MERGAKEVYAYITHGVLSPGSAARIRKSALKALVITDSIHATEEALSTPNIELLTVAPLIGEAIARTANEESVSSLFD
jgi:ribose-phosphate pyrophosphokinase